MQMNQRHLTAVLATARLATVPATAKGLLMRSLTPSCRRWPGLHRLAHSAAVLQPVAGEEAAERAVLLASRRRRACCLSAHCQHPWPSLRPLHLHRREQDGLGAMARRSCTRALRLQAPAVPFALLWRRTGTCSPHSRDAAVQHSLLRIVRRPSQSCPRVTVWAAAPDLHRVAAAAIAVARKLKARLSGERVAVLAEERALRWLRSPRLRERQGKQQRRGRRRTMRVWMSLMLACTCSRRPPLVLTQQAQQ